MPACQLTQLDFMVIGVYLVTVLFIGLRLARRTRTGEDLFLAGRWLGWLPIGFSLFATNISSTTLAGRRRAAAATFAGALFAGLLKLPVL